MSQFSKQVPDSVDLNELVSLPIEKWPTNCRSQVRAFRINIRKSDTFQGICSVSIAIASKKYSEFLRRVTENKHVSAVLPKLKRNLTKEDEEIPLAIASYDLASCDSVPPGDINTHIYVTNTRLVTLGTAYVNDQRLRTFLCVLLQGMSDDSDTLVLFEQGGSVRQNFTVYDASYKLIFLALEAEVPFSRVAEELQYLFKLDEQRLRVIEANWESLAKDNHA